MSRVPEEASCYARVDKIGAKCAEGIQAAVCREMDLLSWDSNQEKDRAVSGDRKTCLFPFRADRVEFIGSRSQPREGFPLEMLGRVDPILYQIQAGLCIFVWLRRSLHRVHAFAQRWRSGPTIYESGEPVAGQG